MTATGKKCLGWAMALVLALTMCAIPAVPSSAYAAEEAGVSDLNTPTMLKKTKVKFDLKKGKTVSYKVCYSGLTKQQKQTATIKSIKKSAAKKGFTKFVVTYELKNTFKPSSSDLKKITGSWWYKQWNETFGTPQVFLLDYTTGQNIAFYEGANPYKATGTDKVVKIKNKTYKSGSDKVALMQTATKRLTVTLPNDYEDACFVIGHASYVESMKYEQVDSDFLAGKEGFGLSGYYKSAKTNWHALRLK